ncbi:Fc.00g076550.m01.CDS01 [Cosmosporella sp. VM-42]
MGDSPQSPRRRHILSSINPDGYRERREPRSDSYELAPETVASPGKRKRSHDEDKTEDTYGKSDTTKPRRSRLKLKDHKSQRHSSRDRHREDDSHSQSHRRHHRRRRRSRSPTPPNPYAPDTLDPDAAFRESLFDAMADDEGASYWQGVYGQPVHVYPKEKVGPTGELEQMTDEDYATYVRQKMWEKTNAGLLEERARREREKEKKKEQERHHRQLQEEMDASLRRGEERRQRRRWMERWKEYTTAWADWDGTPAKLDWPVESGLRGDIDEKNVRLFYISVLHLADPGEQGPFVGKLKDERVRWHPDKIQQRLGGQVDNEIMKDVTAVFQIIDRLWAESRSKA